MKLHTLLIAALIAGLASPALAETMPLVAGKIVKIDPSAGKITIDHQKIPNLDMPPMTMAFRAADPALLAAVKAGERVRFQADTVNGQLTVIKILKAK